MDKYYKYGCNAEIGIEFLVEFFDELIVNFKEKNISSKNLMALTKTKYIIENIEHLEFDDGIGMEAGFEIQNKGGNYYVMSIYMGEVIQSQQGWEYNEGVVSDSVYNEHFYLGKSENLYNSIHNLELWREAFYELTNYGAKFSITDDSENFSKFVYDPEEDDF